MQVSVEATGSLERRMTVEVPAERIESEVKNRLKSLATRVKEAGFRPGKVPMSLVERKYGPQVRQEVMGEVLQRSFYEAVAQEKLNPVSSPKIQPKPQEEGKGLEFTATFEVFPEIELAPVDQVEINKPAVEITDQDIDTVLERIRRQRSSWVTAARPAQNGDRVIIDFTGTLNGEPFAGNQAKQMPVELGTGRMIAGFDEQLLGAKAGDELTLNLTFPADYRATELAGKPVQFAVTVHEVQESVLPEVDETFIKNLGVEEGTQEALRQELKASMGREVEQVVRGKFKQQVMDILYDNNEIEIPVSLIEGEVEALKEHLQHSGRAQEVDQDDSLRAQAQRRVALGMIFAELVKEHGLSVPPARVREAVEQLAEAYGEPEQVVAWYYADKRRLAQVEAMVLEDIIVDWVVGKARITETPTAFDDLMNPGQTQA